MHMKKKVSFYVFFFVVIIGLGISSKVYAENLLFPESKSVSLQYNLKSDIAITVTAFSSWAIMRGFQDDFAPSTCRWCSVNTFDKWGHDNLKWDNVKAASTTSHVMAYCIAPLIAFGGNALVANYDDKVDDFAVNALIIAETVALSSLLNQIVKMSAGRQRPDAHYSGVRSGAADNTSFYSGHTNLAFSLAVSSGTVASMREYRLAPLIWGAGLGVAATTGYLRIAADKHYITDVVAGAVIGSAVGFCVPYFMHKSKEENKIPAVSFIPLKEGAMINFSGRL